MPLQLKEPVRNFGCFLVGKTIRTENNLKNIASMAILT